MVNRESLAGGQLFSAGSCGISWIWSMLNHGSRRDSPRASTVFNSFSREYPRAPTVFRVFSGIPTGTPTGTHGIWRFTAGISTVSHCISANDPAGIPTSAHGFRGNSRGHAQIPAVFRVNPHGHPRCRVYPTVFYGLPRLPGGTPTSNHSLRWASGVSRSNPHGHPRPSADCLGFPR